MLMPFFIAKYDKVQLDKEKIDVEHNPNKKAEYIPISSQNISILQVGANAKAFRHFLEFLGINTLVITDIDTIKRSKTEKGKIIYSACSVTDSPISTSNETLKYYFAAPKFDDNESYAIWFNNLINNKEICISDTVKVTYQQEEKGYCARSFEDAFININRQEIKEHLNDILGLKNVNYFDDHGDIYELTKSILDKKSDFAASLLFFSTYSKC